MYHKVVRKAETVVESVKALTNPMVKPLVNFKPSVKRKKIQTSVLVAVKRRRIEGNRLEVSHHGRTEFTQMAGS
jgi:hypothetical protein